MVIPWSRTLVVLITPRYVVDLHNEPNLVLFVITQFYIESSGFNNKCCGFKLMCTRPSSLQLTLINWISGIMTHLHSLVNNIIIPVLECRY